MALPSIGTLSMLDIVGEFGGSAPHAISEYYGADAGVPSSGQISIQNFYGASNAVIASGGTVSDVSGYRYHTFAGISYNQPLNFTFVISSIGNQTIEYIIIAPGNGNGGGGVQVGAEQLAVGSYAGRAGANYSAGLGSSYFRGKTATKGMRNAALNILAYGTSGAPQNNPNGAPENNRHWGTHWAAAEGGGGGAGGAGGDGTNPSYYHARAGNGGPGYLWLDGKRYGAGRAGSGYDGDVGYGKFYPGTNGAGWDNYGSEKYGFSSVGAVIIRYPL